MNTVHPVDTPLLQSEHPQAHTLAERINQSDLPQLSPLISESERRARYIARMKARITVLDSSMNPNNPSNLIFRILIWLGLVFGIAASIYLSVVRKQYENTSNLLLILVITSYYQIFYFLFGIYTIVQKDAEVTSWFKGLSIFNGVILSIVLLFVLIDMDSPENSLDAGLDTKMFDEFSSPTLAGTLIHLVFIGFLTYQATKFLLLLREKEVLLERIENLERPEPVQNVINDV